MECLINNWYVLVGILSLIVFAGFLVYKFIKSPSSEKTTKIKKWLKNLLTKTEENLDSKEGQTKLRKVYNLIIKTFSAISKVVPFSLFSNMINKAIKTIKELINKEN